jgi:hypothetical protein
LAAWLHAAAFSLVGNATLVVFRVIMSGQAR